MRVSTIVDDPARLAHFRARVLADALTEATRGYWHRRAATFDDAAPRPGDFNGRATPDQLEAARVRCLDAAQACRNRATLEEPGAPVPALVVAVLLEGVPA